MVIFHSYVTNYQRVYPKFWPLKKGTLIILRWNGIHDFQTHPHGGLYGIGMMLGF